MFNIRKSFARCVFSCLDGLIEATPENAFNIVKRGYYRADCGDYDGGIADFSKAIELVPNYGDAYRIRALTYLRKHDVESAMDDIEVDLQLRPENAETHATHGDVLREAGRQSDALRAYTRALDLDPSSAPALVGRGYCDYESGDWEKAIAYFRRGFSQGSKDKDAKVYLKKAEEHLRNSKRKVK